MQARSGPDLLLVGAPKAGTTALHAALALHPQVHVAREKEPKYFLAGGAPPPRFTGPGDRHSNREWIWRRDDYAALYADAPAGSLTVDSTPFYLHDPAAHVRIAAELPEARLVAVLRDPVDRAYSNWMHLWADGLEPERDFVAAVGREDERVAAGYAPFWHYRGLGMYGRQLRHLYDHVERERVLVLRYRELVDEPVRTLDRVCGFLGLQTGVVDRIPSDNVRPYVAPSLRTSAYAGAIRVGARLGAYAPPQVWRRASRPLVERLQRDRSQRRPELSTWERAGLVEAHLEDVALLEEVTGQSFADWRGRTSRGSFRGRAAASGLRPPR